MIRVTVAYSPAPREVREWTVELQPGATVEQALVASGLATAFPELDCHAVTVGIWGRKTGQQSTLREHDRIEVYRLLQVDPKIARRERFRLQGVRSTGLFSRKR